jgi:allene oxide cyclase
LRFTGVMIDLGWPWWVSSIVALAIAAFCATALTRTRSGVARGVLGLVVVQGLALGILSPFVMSSTAGTDGAMTPAAPALADMAPAGASVLHVIEHAPGPDMQTYGQLTTFTNPIFDGSDTMQIGRDQGFCIQINLAKAEECVWTTILPGGAITAEGPEPNTGSQPPLAITGGTGKYRNARGWVFERAHNKAATEWDEFFHLSS